MELNRRSFLRFGASLVAVVALPVGLEESALSLEEMAQTGNYAAFLFPRWRVHAVSMFARVAFKDSRAAIMQEGVYDAVRDGYWVKIGMRQSLPGDYDPMTPVGGMTPRFQAHAIVYFKDGEVERVHKNAISEPGTPVEVPKELHAFKYGTLWPYTGITGFGPTDKVWGHIDVDRA